MVEIILLWAPWLTKTQVQQEIENAIKHPVRWKADELAADIQLTDATRTRLGIQTIGACDISLAERKRRARLRKQKKDRERQRQKRLEASGGEIKITASESQPWRQDGVSRATYYRRRKSQNKSSSPETILSPTKDLRQT